VANFINTRARFYENALSSFSLVTFWLWRKDFGKKSTFVQKMHEQNVDEIDHWF